ncbi:MAG TPA: helix-turn-helix transcriptional regulator [Mesotoga infera]|nr:helix-turn-helix transcriptional regulator [Mesotoga infera]
MKKKKAVSLKTAIDNTLDKSIVSQSDFVYRQEEGPRVPGKGFSKDVVVKHSSDYLSFIDISEALHIFNRFSAAEPVKKAAFCLVKSPEQETEKSGSAHENSHYRKNTKGFNDRPLTTIPGGRNNLHNIASCLLLRLGTDILLKGERSKSKDGKLSYKSVGISISIWPSNELGKVTAPAEEVTANWLAGIEPNALTMHLLFQILVMGADPDKGRTFSIRAWDIVKHLGLDKNKKNFRNNHERVDYVLGLAAHLGRLNYTLNWDKKGTEFSISPEVLWGVEITEGPPYKETVITVTPGKWAEKFLDSEPFVEYTTIDNRVFQIIKEHLARRPHIVRLLLYFLYQERSNHPQGYGPTNCKVRKLLVEMFGTKTFNKATRNMRTRRTLLERFFNALEVLKEFGLVYYQTEETYTLEERYLGDVDDEPPKTKLTREIFSDIIDQNIVLSRWPTDKKKATGKEITLAEIKDRRNKLGLTQRQLAAKIGVNYSTYKSFENGFRNLPREGMKRLKEVVGIPQDTRMVTYKGDKKLIL